MGKAKKFTKYARPVFETADKTSEWFGYYNYDALNHDQTKMLCNRSVEDGCAVKKGMSIELGYYDMPDGGWHSIGWSDSWNWQQGAMLQWLPGKGNETKVIYNFSRDKHFKSCIYDILTGEEHIIDFPVYCVTPDGKKAISLNYERSYWCRAYHYQSVENPVYNVRVAEDDGVFEVDLEKNLVRRILSIQDIIRSDADDNFSIAKHWLEHIMISPDGSRFVVLHRFSLGVGYLTRMCIANIDGTGLQIIDGWRKYNWSHFGWKGSASFAMYTVESSGIAKNFSAPLTAVSTISKKTIKRLMIDAIKKLIPARIRAHAHKRYYQLYDLGENGFALADIYHGSALRIDGHPSFTADGDYMVTDSYPYEDGFRHLIIMNTKNKKCCVIAQLYAGLKNTPASCDLHPKLCRNNQYVVVDTAYDGKHHMICFKIDWKAVKNRID